ncbi:hypothetical protein Pryu01_01460 [Paraliobacillus ryukyuensis]|uniref:Uncharacterized protein n=1 Tax=Paraliobacillus ryukyuensis TaxID=200904 RepID=A0A366EBP3_9BACI|nr:hypothetical protein [Paraliobacillus ryukyuensis]RBO99803.1 hypothetical protein DES48_103130 [Paraliobacillus ryukyuensis]
MKEQLLWNQINEQVEQLLVADESDKELIEDAICLLLLKKKWRKSSEQSNLTTQFESHIVEEIKQLMEKDRNSFEGILSDLNRTFY